MSEFNLNTLLNRKIAWTVSLPDGSVKSGVSIREVPVRIPRIQRDYAEGRENAGIKSKRDSLLNDMLDVVYGIRKGLSFDFIYGYMMLNGAVVKDDSWRQNKEEKVFFEPLDGQQRLTTLFLLYWLFGRTADIQSTSGNHSLFVYETRDTSEEFCHWLVKQDAESVIKGWQKEVANAKKLNEANKERWSTEKNSKGVVDEYANRLRFPLMKVPSLSEYMQGDDTFKWDWHDDPNIHSMITVLEAAVGKLTERELKYDDGIKGNANLDNINFMLLDKLMCDGDQLFEKMNARGKALTSFEILKSSLEEEMELQNLPNTDSALTNNWRNVIDGDWIDFCWDKSDIGSNPTLEKVREVEEKLERLLIRMAGKSLYLTDINWTKPKLGDSVKYGAELENSIAGRENVNGLIDKYIEYARHERSLNSSNITLLDFAGIYNDIQNLLYKDGTGAWHEASEIISQNLDRQYQLLLFDEFMGNTLTHDTRVKMYAMLEYLKIVNATAIAGNNTEKENFVDWMRFVLNVFNADNKTARLDNFEDVKGALRAIDKWLAEYVKNYRTKKPQDVLRLIKDHIKSNAHGQEQARLDEEAIKAELRINGTNGVSPKSWEDSILKAEDNFYLRGQIIASFSWSRNGRHYDKALFDEYVDYLFKIFPGKAYDGEDEDMLLMQAMLCFQDFRHNMKNGLGSLGRLNFHRDYSWKQYLRRADNNGYYGALFKQLIDEWKNHPAFSFAEILKHIIATRKSRFTKTDWQYYVVNISEPENLSWLFYTVKSFSRYVYSKPGGHTYYFRSDTQKTTNRYELLTTYLRFEQKRLLTAQIEDVPELTHTADEQGAYVEFKLANTGDIIRLSVANDDLYDISIQKSGSPVMTPHRQDIGVYDVEQELQQLGVLKAGL